MSAYIVTDETIHAIVQGLTLGSGVHVYMGGPSYRWTTAEADELGQLLVDENYASVNYRYQEDTEPHTYKYQLRIATLAPVALLKQINHYEYQACEHSGWGKSIAKRACEALRDHTIHKLPGYADAPWGLAEGVGA